MRKKDLHKIIRDSGAQDNTLLVHALKAKHPEFADKQKSYEKRSRKFKWLVAVFATLSAAEALALILIPTLLLPSDKTTPPEEIWGGSSQIVTYRTTKINGSIQEYNDTHNTDFLFFDTVEYDYQLYEYRSLDNKFLGLQVHFIYDYYDEHIGYTVCPQDVEFDIVSYDISVCTNEGVVFDCPAKWGTSGAGSSYGIFSYEGYDYYIYVNGDTARLFELIQDLLPSQP